MVDLRQPHQQTSPSATLIERKDITSDLMVIKLKLEQTMDFKPGQYCTLGLEGIERAYSIASAPHEAHLEIFVELVPLPDGALTPLMWNMKKGDKISIRPRCKGIFVLDYKYMSHLMMSTVTGVAPFVSMLRSYFHRGSKGHRFYVIQGASNHDEFVYKDELEWMAEKYSDSVRYVPTVSRPIEDKNRDWKGEIGRANIVVEKYIEEFALNPETTLVYACGHPGMIEDTKERLTPTKFKVKEERFWKQ